MNKKIKKLNVAVVVLLAIAATVLFLGSMDLTTLICSKYVTFPGYGQQLVSEAVGFVVTMIMLIILRYTRVLKETGEGFLNGFYVGGFMTAYCIFQIVAQFYLQLTSGTAKAVSFGEIVIYTATMFFIGLNEELVFRGIILNLFLDKFGNSKKGILTSVIFSGVIFGAIHITNIFSGVSVSSAIVQMLEAMLLGILFAEIYLRSENIWITIIAHALTDFASMMASGIFGDGSFVDSINNLSAINLIAIPIFLTPVIILFRKSKLDELVQKRNGVVVIPSQDDVEKMSITSLILGIIGIVTGCAGYGMAFGVVGLFGGILGLKRSDKQGGLPVAAVVTSVIAIVISVLAFVVMIFVMPQLQTTITQIETI